MALKLMAELGLDGSGFEAGMRRAEHSVHRIGDGLKEFVVGAVGVTTVGLAIEKTVQTAEELINTSKRLSIAPEQLQVLRRAAKESGTEMDNLAAVFEKIDIARDKARGGDSKAKHAFGTLGITPGMLTDPSMTAAKLFMGPMSNAAKTRNTEDLATAFRELMGKGFGQVVPTLKTDFDELGQKMRETGAIMSEDTLVKLKMMGEELTFLGQIIISHVGPALVKFAEMLYSAALSAGKWISGTSAAFGAMTSKMGIKDVPGASMNMLSSNVQALWGLIKGKSMDDVALEWGDRMNTAGFDMDAVAGAKEEAEKPWDQLQGQFKDFLDKMAKMADELKNPKAPEFDKPITKMAKKALETPSDSMTKVGNFLGGMGIANSLDREKVKLLADIARNTRGHKSTDRHTAENNTNYPHC